MVGLFEMERIQKKGETTPLEQSIATILNEIQAGSEEGMKKALTNLKITGVKEVSDNGLKVVIVSVPYKQIAAYRAIQGFLVPELEKKVENSQVVIVGKRRAFPKEPVRNRRYVAIRPTGRTLRAVNESLLDDVVYPTAIVGKRIHYDLKGGQTTHVILDQHDRTRVEERLAGFALAYNRLTGIRTVFEVADH
ncbi:40S ribosomal protein S7 [Tritrichomonas foetus]|uniref:40S ribosomal protein S7 n=1 Tax=Tritrichomonas foetus TaxID=1144522 RepID=A0A1J4K406_9EUKA|nr:40S ribosomal protein S7 [Tritrichomonas foetus]OHT04430.1 40S ribosomal protein S7 [Tritrichomonas foetus]|eukprot:OHT04430.1 40S ribosomal protein S7 [Tritrichomonas foetus]